MNSHQRRLAKRRAEREGKQPAKHNTKTTLHKITKKVKPDEKSVS